MLKYEFFLNHTEKKQRIQFHSTDYANTVPFFYCERTKENGVIEKKKRSVSIYSENLKHV